MSDDKEAEEAAKEVLRRMKELEAATNAEMVRKETERKLQERAAEYEAERNKDK